MESSRKLFCFLFVAAAIILIAGSSEANKVEISQNVSKYFVKFKHFVTKLIFFFYIFSKEPSAIDVNSIHTINGEPVSSPNDPRVKRCSNGECNCQGGNCIFWDDG